MDNNKVKPLGKKEFENDKKLEQKLIDVQEQLGCLRGILSDEYSNAIVHAFQKFKAPFSGKIVHIFPEQSAVI